MNSIEQFTAALTQVSDFVVTDTAREQANKCVKEGNPYFAALLRELANRVDRNKPVTPGFGEAVMDSAIAKAEAVVAFEDGTPIY